MKKGKIHLVGFGPGAEQHMSYRAREAIAESDVIIGYTTYIKLVQDLLDGKEVIKKGMTEEIDRCIEAYDHAKQGKSVALISSGDIGVYGMAGPTYEVLLKAGWTPDSDIEVEVVPGTTALSACASLVGAPLTHDFCSISLSDLLTPWPTIAKRIEAAASSDFVIALYNPKSGRRTQQIVEAQNILLRHRSPDTPVAIVKSAYREAQDIQMVRLSEMKDCKIGMLSTVLIGNSHSFSAQGLMITPRGYANKYDEVSGEVKEGEKAGRSLSMGLQGWHGCVRQFMRDGNGTNAHSLRDVCRYFDAAPGQIYQAIADATEQDHAGDYHALKVKPGSEYRALLAASQWGRIRIVVRSEAGAVGEMMLHDLQFEQKGDWMNIENKNFHVHINWAKVDSAWMVKKSKSLRGLNFVDAAGETVFNLSMVRENGQFSDVALDHYDTAWQMLA